MLHPLNGTFYGLDAIPDSRHSAISAKVLEAEVLKVKSH